MDKVGHVKSGKGVLAGILNVGNMKFHNKFGENHPFSTLNLSGSTEEYLVAFLRTVVFRRSQFVKQCPGLTLRRQSWAGYTRILEATLLIG